MKSYFIHLAAFVLLFANPAVYADPTTGYAHECEAEAPHASHTQFFKADLEEGLIGYLANKPLDNPEDNVFQVTLPDLPDQRTRVWLMYELNGVQDHTAISRSINDELSQGGYLVKKSDQWLPQKEELNASWLKTGVNNIRFSLPENAGYHYKIRKLGILVEEVPDLENGYTSPERAIVINQPENFQYFDRQGYFKGFITGKDSDKAKLYIDGKQITTQATAFEYLAKKPEAAGHSWEVLVVAMFPDGSTLKRIIPFQQAIAADYINSIASFNTLRTGKRIGADPTQLHLKGAELYFPAEALPAPAVVSITALRDVDIVALDQGMVNVTQSYSGYRFLPHGSRFEREVSVSLAYDESKIPHGYTVQDIRTYFFDEQSKHWVPLRRDSVDTVNKRIISATTHFTDMINGVIQVPESPETGAFNPNSLSEVAAANPAAAITTIEPPSANPMGSAAVSFPITLPPGRQGMEPELAITYNSEGGNGWLGLGWDLTIPAVTIDTRWGVPRYDPDFETETYLLAGEQLYPVAHREAAIPREQERSFHPRVEAGFEKIIRHGEDPTDYWWEVTDKSGTRYFYGGTPTTGIEENSVLRDEAGHIAYWALREVRDLNDNFISYECRIAEEVGIRGGQVPGFEIYPQKITYTGHGSNEGPFDVIFTGEEEGATRPDTTIDARLGFKRVTADRLRKIAVQFNEQNIRSYALHYTEGAFHKTLLQSIEEFDAAGVLFHTHTFEYYDDVHEEGEFQPLQGEEAWTPQSDHIRGTFLNPLDLFNDNASAISGNRSIGGGFGMAVTVGGFDGLLLLKLTTVGAHFGFSASKNEGLLSLIDINGDGLADKVYKDGDKLLFRPNLSGPKDSTIFGEEPIDILGIKDFSRGKSFSGELGLQAHFGLFAGFQYSPSKSITSTYFSDVNGDRLVDIVNDGTVYFNHLDDLGRPTFTKFSSDTPSEIGSTGVIDSNLVVVDTAEQAKAEADHPLHDVVRVWEAPYDGTIAILDGPTLLEDTSEERAAYTGADGVRVAIQHNAVELWSTEIDSLDYAQKVPTGVNSVSVTKGDRLYFRVQSDYDGAYDQVSWSPQIRYASHTPGLNDANGLPIYEFDAANDFLLTAPMAVVMPIDGTIHIDADFSKPVTSDSIHLEITSKDTFEVVTTVWSRTLSWDEVVNDAIDIDLTVKKMDNLFFRISARTNIDWTQLDWNPSIHYTASFDPSIDKVFNGTTPLLAFQPVVDLQAFPQMLQPSLPWEAPDTTTIMVLPDLPSFLPITTAGEIVFSVKKNNELLAKQLIEYNRVEILGQLIGVEIVSTPDSISVSKKAGDQLFFEYHTRSSALAKALGTAQVSIISDTMTVAAPAGVHSGWEEYLFGALYRHWGQFGYNGNEARRDQPIDESLLNIDDLILDAEEPIDFSGDIDTTGNTSARDMGESMNQTYATEGGNRAQDEVFIYMIPDLKEQIWRGYDNLTYVSRTVISSSRMGEDDLRPLNPIMISSSGAASGAVGINRIGKTNNWSVSLGVGPAGFSASEGDTRQLYDYIDMNGDQHPDILSESKIQYTHPYGGLEDSATDQNSFGTVHETTHNAIGFTFGGTFLQSSSPNSDDAPKGEKADDAQEQSETAAGIGGSANFSVNTDKTSFAWMDINGDGLPDRVYSNGGAALNLGYHFAAVEPWGFHGISDGQSISYGGGLSINIGNNSISAGVGLSRSMNQTDNTLEDMNGDGLLDVVANGPTIMVAINTGNGFADPIPWKGADVINEGVSTGETAHAAITACIPLIPLVPVAKLCFNPSVNVSQGADRSTARFEDLDGDGFPDLLKSDKDDELLVKRSTIRRTNKLKKVNRPLGADFTLNYKRTGNSYDMPNHIWALTSVEVYDGFDHDGANRMLSTFEYEDGFFDRHEREFYGFGKVKTIQHDTENDNAPYRSVVQEYLNRNYYEKGLVTTEILQDADGRKYTETLNRYVLKDIETGDDITDPAVLQADNGAAFPALVETVEKYYEGRSDAGKSTRMTYRYDQLGNITSYTDFGEPGEADDDYTATISYHPDPADKYLKGIPSAIVVTGGVNHQLYRKRETSIDENTGLTTEIRQFLASGEKAVYNMSYDAFGNMTRIIRPPNADNDRLQFEYTYDPEVHTYITQVKDSYEYRSSSTYDFRFGQMLSATDLNGQETQYTIDNVGRVLTVRGPFEIAAGVDYTIAFEYHPDAAVPWALTRHYDPAHPENFIETVTFIDGLGREVQVKKDGAVFTAPGAADTEKMLVSGTTIFDAFGRTVKAYYPLAEPKGQEGTINLDLDPIPPTRTAYDVLDRPVSMVLPDLATTEMVYDFGTDRDGNTQFRTRVTDANGIWKEQFTNVRGLTKATREQHSQGSDVWTSYAFNPIDELKKITDDQGNEIEFAYDHFGRRTGVLHPDAGLTNLKYDLAGNLIQKITANLQAGGVGISYSYDHERLTHVNYPKHPENNVVYTYGEPGASDNRANRLVSQQDASGTQEFFYDALGSVIKNVRVIKVPGTEPLTFTTEWTYDTWNRVTEMVYPDGETLTYTYNLGGGLHSMSGEKEGTNYPYLTQLSYDKFEDRVFLSYGNGTVCTYAYEPERRRLQSLTAKTARGRKMMDNHYHYDPVDNIVRITNQAPIPTSNLMGGSSDYQYTYDDLYRLTEAAGTFNGSNHEHRYELTMVYDNIYNILSKDQQHERKGYDELDWAPRNRTTYALTYEYNTHLQPHAPVHIGEQTYTYDANGNQTGWEHDVSAQNRAINWDEENRIRSISDNGEVFHYTYDAGYERVLKSNGGGETVSINGDTTATSQGIGNYTVYVNPYLVIRSSNISKHFYIGSERIVTKLGENSEGLLQEDEGSSGNGNGNGNSNGNGQNNGNGNHQEAFQFYYHPDHLGNTAYITDASGEVYQHLEYFPFGETFIEEHSNTERTPYLYNGKELDEETGLYYYGARYYDAQTSVWESVDPLWVLQDEVNKSPYVYVIHSPLLYGDPTGKGKDKTGNKRKRAGSVINPEASPAKKRRTDSGPDVPPPPGAVEWEPNENNIDTDMWLASLAGLNAWSKVAGTPIEKFRQIKELAAQYNAGTKYSHGKDQAGLSGDHSPSMETVNLSTNNWFGKIRGRGEEGRFDEGEIPTIRTGNKSAGGKRLHTFLTTLRDIAGVGEKAVMPLSEVLDRTLQAYEGTLTRGDAGFNTRVNEEILLHVGIGNKKGKIRLLTNERVNLYTAQKIINDWYHRMGALIRY